MTIGRALPPMRQHITPAYTTTHTHHDQHNLNNHPPQPTHHTLRSPSQRRRGVLHKHAQVMHPAAVVAGVGVGLQRPQQPLQVAVRGVEEWLKWLVVRLQRAGLAGRGCGASEHVDEEVGNLAGPCGAGAAEQEVKGAGQGVAYVVKGMVRVLFCLLFYWLLYWLLCVLCCVLCCLLC